MKTKRAEIVIRFDVPEDQVRPGFLEILCDSIEEDIRELGENAEIEGKWLE